MHAITCFRCFLESLGVVLHQFNPRQIVNFDFIVLLRTSNRSPVVPDVGFGGMENKMLQQFDILFKHFNIGTPAPEEQQEGAEKEEEQEQE